MKFFENLKFNKSALEIRKTPINGLEKSCK